MFEDLQLTNNGLALVTAILNGHNVEFTKIKMGSGTPSGNRLNMTDLVKVEQSLQIQRKSILTQDSINIGTNLLGSQVITGFNWCEIGIFAKDNDGDGIEKLFSYSHTSQGVPIPAGGAVTEQLIDIVVAVGNVDNITVTIDTSTALVTQDQMAAYQTDINSQLSTMQTTLNSNIDKKMVNTYVAGGTATVHTVSISGLVPNTLTNLTNKVFHIVFPEASGTTHTLNVNGLGAKNIVSQNNDKSTRTLYANELVANTIYAVFYNGTAFVLLNGLPEKATQAQAQTATDDSRYVTPARVLDTITSKGVIGGNMKIIVGGSQPAPTAGTTIIWIDTSS